MKNIYQPETLNELTARLENLRQDSERQWGKMSSGQMLGHCREWMEMASGGMTPSRSLLGRIFGRLAKRRVLGVAEIGHNMPTEKRLIVSDNRDFAVEKEKLQRAMETFAEGPERCTQHPHCFFGPMTPPEWARMAYKPLDHHFRQFGA
jgi:hypothetical protein